MDAVMRAVATYFFVWLIFRVAGKRSLASITTFDFVLLLIISETTQAALVDNDNSMTNSFLLISTMVGVDVGLSLVKQRSRAAEKVIDGVPLVVLADGIPLHDRMAKSRIDEGDILAAARQLQGLERLEQIKYAVLERHGGITIVPKEGQGGG
jgi:uncharacterized membrane protein YcaP (DUF421 family)